MVRTVAALRKAFGYDIQSRSESALHFVLITTATAATTAIATATAATAAAPIKP